MPGDDTSVLQVASLDRASNDICDGLPYNALDRFLRHVAATPDAVAVEHDSGALTYRQLAEHAEGYARQLSEQQVGADTPVAIELPRSPQYLAALLGTWICAAVAVPVDASAPQARRAYQLRKAGCRVSITSNGMEGFGERLVADLDCDQTPRFPPVSPGDPAAYVIFTSGSTGTAKGVQVGHRSLSEMLAYFARLLPAGPGRSTLALSSVTFDVSMLELLLPLTVGGTVSIAPAAAPRNPEILADWLREHPVSVLQATPTWWRLALPILGGELSDVVAVSAGEALSAELARRLLDRVAAVWNLYGPTESTVYALAWKVARPLSDPLPIGAPVQGVGVTLVAEHGDVPEPGEPGELLLSGPALAHGYVNDPNLTEEAFITNQAGTRMYRTGDVCKFRQDGLLQYLGRKDHQVKVRGHRVELEEIEAVAEAHPAVALTVASVVVTDGQAVAVDLAVVGRPGTDLDTRDVRAFLRSRLPEYMVPRRIVQMAELPQTASGKVDRLNVAQRLRERAAIPLDAPPVGSRDNQHHQEER